MDTACFTTSQRTSCLTMNPDLFKPCPEHGQIILPTKPNKPKSEQIKPDLAQVVTDSKTGKSYSKGKLLGKVYYSINVIYVLLCIAHTSII